MLFALKYVKKSQILQKYLILLGIKNFCLGLRLLFTLNVYITYMLFKLWHLHILSITLIENINNRFTYLLLIIYKTSILYVHFGFICIWCLLERNSTNIISLSYKETPSLFGLSTAIYIHPGHPWNISGVQGLQICGSSKCVRAQSPMNFPRGVSATQLRFTGSTPWTFQIGWSIFHESVIDRRPILISRFRSSIKFRVHKLHVMVRWAHLKIANRNHPRLRYFWLSAEGGLNSCKEIEGEGCAIASIYGEE